VHVVVVLHETFNYKYGEQQKCEGLIENLEVQNCHAQLLYCMNPNCKYGERQKCEGLIENLEVQNCHAQMKADEHDAKSSHKQRYVYSFVLWWKLLFMC
jgi:hypothetical protein